VLQGEPESIGPSLWRLGAIDVTEKAGVYRLELEGASSEPFTAQADAQEGDLERLTPTEVSAVHPALELVGRDSRHTPRPGRHAAAKGEIWRGIAIACFVALVFESLWAAWLGRKRRVA
jgi:hypothetical protein